MLCILLLVGEAQSAIEALKSVFGVDACLLRRERHIRFLFRHDRYQHRFLKRLVLLNFLLALLVKLPL